jgi:hypothetical protein
MTNSTLLHIEDNAAVKCHFERLALLTRQEPAFNLNDPVVLKCSHR